MAEENKQEVKPCPFCGSRAKCEGGHASCSKCNTGWFRIENWNTRADSKPDVHSLKVGIRDLQQTLVDKNHEIYGLKSEVERLTKSLRAKGVDCLKHDLVGGWACPVCLAEALAEVDRLKEQLSKFQMSEFHPDWSFLEAANGAILEHRKAHEETAKELDEYKRLLGVARDAISGIKPFLDEDYEGYITKVYKRAIESVYKAIKETGGK